jgi:hypothetical protein
VVEWWSGGGVVEDCLFVVLGFQYLKLGDVRDVEAELKVS